jgi:hypothetical protein
MAIGEAGGVEAVLDIMRAFPQVQDVQQPGTFVLLQLIECSANKERLVASGGLDVLLVAMKAFSGTKVAEQGQQILCLLADVRPSCECCLEECVGLFCRR